MRIRAAKNSDADAVRALVFGVLRSYGLQHDTATTDRDLENIEQSYHSNGGYFAVLVDESDRVVGSYGLFRTSAQECELRKMYLAAPHRGRGLGKMLLEDALATAERLGFAAVTLETASVLKEAIALYRKYGFEPYAAPHLSARCDQAFRRSLRASRRSEADDK